MAADLKFGSKVVVEVCSQLCYITYDLENTDSNLQGYKQKYEQSKENLNKLIVSDTSSEDIDLAIAETKTAYKDFISELTKELEKQGAVKGETV